MEIPSFLKSDFAAGPCCCQWSHSMRTRVWVIKNVLFHAPPWQLRQGKRPYCSQRSPQVAGSSGDGSGGGGDGSSGGGVAGGFPFS